MSERITPDDLETAIDAVYAMVLYALALVLVTVGFAVDSLAQTSSELAGAAAAIGAGTYVLLVATAIAYDGRVRRFYYGLPWNSPPTKTAVFDRTWSNGDPVGSDD